MSVSTVVSAMSVRASAAWHSFRLVYLVTARDAWQLSRGGAPGILCPLPQWAGSRRVCFHAAGRNNLINAIRLHGGFQVVADILQRERLHTRRPAVTDRRVILRKVRRVQQTLGLPPDEFPTREQFEACQMPNVVGWITTAGGFRKVRTRYLQLCPLCSTWCRCAGMSIANACFFTCHCKELAYSIVLGILSIMR